MNRLNSDRNDTTAYKWDVIFFQQPKFQDNASQTEEEEALETAVNQRWIFDLVPDWTKSQELQLYQDMDNINNAFSQKQLAYLSRNM